jgi:nitroreductase
MDFFETAERRRSVRAFESREVEETDLTRILEAANRAPSAGNLQAYEIVVVRDPERRRRLARAAGGQEFVAQTPVVLVFCANSRRCSGHYGSRGRELYALQDATIAAAYAQLAVTALGLASVWVGAFNEKTVTGIVWAPKHLRPVILLPIGHPGEQPAATPRRKLADLAREEKFE